MRLLDQANHPRPPCMFQLRTLHASTYSIKDTKLIQRRKKRFSRNPRPVTSFSQVQRPISPAQQPCIPSSANSSTTPSGRVAGIKMRQETTALLRTYGFTHREHSASTTTTQKIKEHSTIQQSTSLRVTCERNRALEHGMRSSHTWAVMLQRIAQFRIVRSNLKASDPTIQRDCASRAHTRKPAKRASQRSSCAAALNSRSMSIIDTPISV